MPDLTTLVGYVAMACSTASFAPQAWRIVKTRDVSAISTKMYVITVVGFALWLAYGVLRIDWPLIVANAVCLALATFILVMKLLPTRKREVVADMATKN